MSFWKFVDSAAVAVNYAQDFMGKINKSDVLKLAGYASPESSQSLNTLRTEVPQQRLDIFKFFEEDTFAVPHREPNNDGSSSGSSDTRTFDIKTEKAGFTGQVSQAGVKAGTIIDWCTESIQKSQQLLTPESSKNRYLVNRHQCSVLVDYLSRALGIIKDDYDPSFEQKILLLEELLHTFVDAETVIKASCCTMSSSQWPRAALENLSMEETFSELIANTLWFLQQILPRKKTDHENELNELHALKKKNDLKKMNASPRRDLLRAAKLDAESLKERLRSTVEQMGGRVEKNLANQLLNRLESASHDLVFMDPADLGIHKGLTGTLIGEGTSGAVMTFKFMGMECATKRIPVWPGSTSVGSKLKEPFQKEMDAIKTLGNHPHIVRLFCYSLANDACFLVMERMHMDLLTLLRSRQQKKANLSVAEATSLMLQIGEGMSYIHGKGAAHRDLKPGNVLINVDDPSNVCSRIRRVKIADFGQTKTTEASKTLPDHTHNTGTTMYMAPEVISLQREDDPTKVDVLNPMRADVYSFGILCCQILTMENPYEQGMTKDMKQKLKAGTLPRPALPRWCPRNLSSLIKRCWDGDRSQRPLFPDICKELRAIRGKQLKS